MYPRFRTRTRQFPFFGLQAMLLGMGVAWLMLNSTETSLLPFLIYFLAVLLLVATMLGLSYILGQHRANKATNMPFESGVLSVGSPQMHLSVEFYLVAIFFVIFDLETVFIFAWAVAFFELGWEGFIAVVVFIFILGVALVYELSTSALDWGIKSRTGESSQDTVQQGEHQ